MFHFSLPVLLCFILKSQRYMKISEKFYFVLRNLWKHRII